MRFEQEPTRGPDPDRKRLTRRAVLAGIPAATLLAAQACSKSSDKTSIASEKKHSGPVTLTYGLWDDTQLPAMKKIIAEFEKANPKIHVRTALTPWDSY